MADLTLYRKAFKAMGSPCEIHLYGATPAQAEQAANLAIADVARLEGRYSRYRTDSLLSDINRVAAIGGRIDVDEETAGLLNYAVTCYEQSDGLFDVTSGLLRQVWRFDRAEIPAGGQIERLLERIGWDKVRWSAPTLTFTRPGMELDFGGIVKEYAADRVAAMCWQAGVRHGFVNLGGDVKIIGSHPDGGPWRIGIRHPRQRHGLLDTVALSGGALASSGDYERCITIGEERYGHVLNPRTGWPVQYLVAVSVAADFCVVAGSASTIAMLKERDGPAWLESLGVEHLWVTVDGRVGGSLLGAGHPAG